MEMKKGNKLEVKRPEKKDLLTRIKFREKKAEIPGNETKENAKRLLEERTLKKSVEKNEMDSVNKKDTQNNSSNSLEKKQLTKRSPNIKKVDISVESKDMRQVSFQGTKLEQKKLKEADKMMKEVKELRKEAMDLKKQEKKEGILKENAEKMLKKASQLEQRANQLEKTALKLKEEARKGEIHFKGLGITEITRLSAAQLMNEARDLRSRASGLDAKARNISIDSGTAASLHSEARTLRNRADQKETEAKRMLSKLEK